MSQRKLHVGKGDEVLVLSGKDVGRRGVILSIFPDKSRAVVEGIHMIKRHMRPNQMGEGGIVDLDVTLDFTSTIETPTPTPAAKRSPAALPARS